MEDKVILMIRNNGLHISGVVVVFSNVILSHFKQMRDICVPGAFNRVWMQGRKKCTRNRLRPVVPGYRGDKKEKIFEKVRIPAIG
jgi:hypothetical protein